jgi:hypothetical protein
MGMYIVVVTSTAPVGAHREARNTMSILHPMSEAVLLEGLKHPEERNPIRQVR